jgi:hypothetical protein
MVRTLGPKLGPLLLRPNLTHRPAEYANRNLPAIAHDDLQTAIDQAVAEHNGRLCTDPETIRFSLIPKYAEYFARRLREFASRRQEKPQARRSKSPASASLATTGNVTRLQTRPGSRHCQGRETARTRERYYEPKSTAESRGKSRTRDAIRRKLGL